MLGIVPVGYGDGYPVALSNKAVTCLPQFRTGPDYLTAPVMGRVSMDQIVIDLTDAAATLEAGRCRRSDDADPRAQLLGAEVELISDDAAAPCSLPRLAQAAGTSCYEMLCRISPNVVRRYIAANAPDAPVGGTTRMID
jgi:alanine racemase